MSNNSDTDHKDVWYLVHRDARLLVGKMSGRAIAIAISKGQIKQRFNGKPFYEMADQMIKSTINDFEGSVGTDASPLESAQETFIEQCAQIFNPNNDQIPTNKKEYLADNYEIVDRISYMRDIIELAHGGSKNYQAMKEIWSLSLWQAKNKNDDSEPAAPTPTSGDAPPPDTAHGNPSFPQYPPGQPQYQNIEPDHAPPQKPMPM